MRTENVVLMGCLDFEFFKDANFINKPSHFQTKIMNAVQVVIVII